MINIYIFNRVRLPSPKIRAPGPHTNSPGRSIKDPKREYYPSRKREATNKEHKEPNRSKQLFKGINPSTNNGPSTRGAKWSIWTLCQLHRESEISAIKEH